MPMGFKLNSSESDVLLNKTIGKSKKKGSKKVRADTVSGKSGNLVPFDRSSGLCDDSPDSTGDGFDASDEDTNGEHNKDNKGVSDKRAVVKLMLLLFIPPIMLVFVLYLWFFPICQSIASTDIETVTRSSGFERFVIFCRNQVEFRDTVLGTESELVQNEEKTKERKKNVAKKSTLRVDEFDAESVYPGGDIPYNVDNEEHFSSLFERGADDVPIVAETMSDKNICRLVKVDTGKYKLVVNRSNTDFSVVVLSYYTVTINGIDASCAPDDRPMLYIKDTGSAFDISKGTDNNGDYLLLENSEGTNITNDEAVRVLKTYESMIENVKWDFDSI